MQTVINSIIRNPFTSFLYLSLEKEGGESLRNELMRVQDRQWYEK